MPQTFLGLLALALAALMAFSQQRATMQSYEMRLRDEHAVAGAGMLTQAMELIAARSFDAASTPAGIHALGRLPNVGDFTLATNFGHSPPVNPDGSSGLCELLRPESTPLCMDVDDFHGTTWQEVLLPVGVDQEMPFQISISVAYVSDHNPEVFSSVPTHSKLVVIRARTPIRPAMGEVVRLERVITYDPVKAQAEYELIYGSLDPL